MGTNTPEITGCGAHPITDVRTMYEDITTFPKHLDRPKIRFKSLNKGICFFALGQSLSYIPTMKGFYAILLKLS